MGGSKDLSSLGGIDTCPGSLVWILRRNGSWWPGRIMGLDEVPAPSLLSPKLGTPVKLLGKNDAAIDWYNIEKSKRIKAFRCGEFDRCIEKVKNFAAHVNNKTVKYARREEAILHALELESLRNCSISKDTAESQSQSSVSCEHSGCSNALKEEFPLPRKRCITPHDSEDDSHEGTKRMKGLKDLESALPSCCPENGTGTSFSHTKRVSKVGHIQENSKRKSRRRTLTKVLKVSSKVGVSSFCDGLTEIKVGFGSFGTDNGNSSVVINNGSETSGTSARKEDNSCNACQSLESSVGDYQSHYPKLQIGFCDNFLIESPLSNRYHTADALDFYFVALGKQAFQHIPVELITLNNERLDETGSTSASVNICSTKYSVESSANGDVEDENLKGVNRSSNEISSSLSFAEKMRSHEENSLVDNSSSFNSLQSTDYCRQLTCGINQPCCELSSQCSQRNCFSSVSEKMTIHPRFQKWQFFQCPCQPANKCGSLNCLHDVHVDVDSISKSKHTPLISVMSKMNNRAIIGHNILVQILEDGACDLLAMKAYQHFGCVENEYKDHEKVKTGCDSSSRLRNSRKKGLRSFMQLSVGSKRKLAKIRKSGFLSRKIRKLSSIPLGNGHAEKARKSLLDKLSSRVTACVPIKAVFSRISKALSSTSRPPGSCLNGLAA